MMVGGLMVLWALAVGACSATDGARSGSSGTVDSYQSTQSSQSTPTTSSASSRVAMSGAQGERSGSFAPAGRSADAGAIPASVVDKALPESVSSFASTGDDYRIGPYDVLTIAVFNVSELSGDFQVGMNGRVALPLVGSTLAAGLTPDQLRQELTKSLGASYLQSPQVSVAVKEYKSQRITVEGAVTKPGVFEMNGSTSLLQAIAMAEGATRYAEPENTLIFRRTNGQRTAARFDIKQIRAGKMRDPELQAGDVVVVAESNAKASIREIIQFLPLASAFALIL